MACGGNGLSKIREPGSESRRAEEGGMVEGRLRAEAGAAAWGGLPRDL